MQTQLEQGFPESRFPESRFHKKTYIAPETLPLFPESALRGCEPVLPPPSSQQTASVSQKPRNRGLTAASVNPHLVAAKKLSRKIKYLPDHSQAQAETAHAICEHLRLLLSDSRES